MKKYIIVIATFGVLVAACNNNGGQDQQPSDKVVVAASEKGAAIFQEKCAMCHAMNSDIAGPALKGVMGRWDNDEVRLKAFIQNNTKAIAAGDPQAVRTYEKYKTTMPVFSSLTDEELSSLVAFLKD